MGGDRKKMANKKTDPRGIQAAKDFVLEVAALDDFALYGRPYINLSKLRSKARRIRGKFRRKR